MTLDVIREARRVERAAEANPLQTIRGVLDTLTGARRRVAEEILADPAFAGGASITALAERAGTLPATISRLAATLGYPGYPALRAAIAEEKGRDAQAGWEHDIGTEIRPGDSPDQVLSVLTGRQFGAMRSAMSSIDLPAIESVAERIAAAAKVQIFAEWGDYPPALELQMRLMRIGVPVWVHDGAYAAVVGASQLGADDVAIMVVRSGESTIAARFREVAKSTGALVVILTGEPDTELSRSADVVLFTGTGVGHSWTDYFAGRISDSLTTALLWVLVAQRMPQAIETGYEQLSGEPRASS
jgi:DNA-binding MurR/RpiR family transcriptional regulator